MERVGNPCGKCEDTFCQCITAASVPPVADLRSLVRELVEMGQDQLELMRGYRSRMVADGALVAARQVADRIEMVSALLARAEREIGEGQ